MTSRVLRVAQRARDETTTAWRLYIGLGVAATILYFRLHGALQPLLITVLCSAGAIAMVLAAHRRKDVRKTPWYLIAACLVCFGAGNLVWAIYHLRIGIIGPFPSLADALYLPGFPCLIAAIALMTPRRIDETRANLIGTIVLTLGAGSVAWIFLMAPYANEATFTLVQRTVSILYPTMDVVALAAATRFIYNGGAYSVAGGSLVVGIFLMAAADLGYSALALADRYYVGSPIDTGWLLAFVLYGSASLHPSAAAVSRPPAKSRLRARATVWDPSTHATSFRAQTVLLVAATLAVVSAVLVTLLVEQVKNTVLDQRTAEAVEWADSLELGAQGRDASGGPQAALRFLQARAEALSRQHGVTEVIITNADLVIIADSDPERRGQVYSKDVLRRVLAIGSPVHEPEGRDEYLFAAPVELPSGPGVLEVEMDLPNLFAAISGARREALISAVVVLLVAIPLVSILAGRRLTKARDAERRVERRFRSLVDNSSGILTVISDEADVYYIGANVSRVLGYSASNITGSKFAELIHPDDRRGFDQALKEVIDDPSLRPVVEWRMRHHDGRWIVGETVMINMLNDSVVDGLVLSTRDVSQQRALETHIRQAQKMEAVGQLAGGVAHDFNNLLGVILNYAEFVAEDFDENDSRREDMAEIRRAAERGSDLTRQLLAFSRRDVIHPRVIDAGQILQGLERMLRRTLSESIELKTSVAPGLRSTKIDPAQLEQVILNLSINAKDAMPTGGTLSLDVANAAIDEDFARQHEGLSPGNHLRLTVSDTGIGMDEATIQRIFEPFFTTKERGSGTGLGLATVYGIVNHAGGHVSAFSEVGMGSTFVVFLPATTESTETSQDAILLPEQVRTRTVLVVEDEDAVRGLVERILTRAGFSVLTAPSGPEALKLLALRSNEIEVLLTDVVMPKMSGKELAERVRDERPEIKVAYMSGYAESAITEQGMLQPGENHLQKPFTAQELLAMLAQLDQQATPTQRPS